MDDRSFFGTGFTEGGVIIATSTFGVYNIERN